MTSIQKLASILDQVRWKGNDAFMARCPCHDDRHPSLSVRQQSNGISVKCHAGCDTRHVRKALGLTRVRLEKTFDYENEEGELVFQVVRSEPKGFRQRRPDGDGWVWNLNGITIRPLYRLPMVRKAKPKRIIFVVEGEKDADALAALSLVATTTSGGAGKPKLTDLSPLDDRSVILVPDNDDAGRRHMRQLAHSIHGKAKRVRILDLPNLAEKEDVSDWLEAGGTKNELIRLARAAPVYKPRPGDDGLGEPASQAVLIRMSDIKPEQIEWLWDRRYARGKLNLLAGDPGLGKSVLALDVAARVSSGSPWPDCDANARIGSAIILSAEDDPADTIRPRLDAAGADVNRVHLLTAVRKEGRDNERHFDLGKDLDSLRQAIDRIGDVEVVVIDPITAYMGSIDGNSNTDVRSILAPVMKLAMETGVAILAVTHLRKHREGNAKHQVMGSLGFVACARVVLGVTEDPNDPTKRLLTPVKSNFNSRSTSLEFSLANGPNDAPVVLWGNERTDIRADDLFSGNSRERGALEEAVDFLRSELADGPVAITKLHKRAEEAGITSRTLKRAKERLRIRSRKTDYKGGWKWMLPEGDPTQKGTQGPLGRIGPKTPFVYRKRPKQALLDVLRRHAQYEAELRSA